MKLSGGYADDESLPDDLYLRKRKTPTPARRGSHV